MRIVPGAAALAADREAGPLAVAIGNFDGVHLGHQALLREAVARAARAGGQAAALTFDPHPARLFAPDRAPPLIMSLGRRLELLAEAGVEVAVVQPFTREFASASISFGRGRAGDTGRLAELGGRLGVGVAVVPPVTVDGHPCSSTKIRQLVADGRTVDAARLLGRPYEIEGPVARGAGRGRGLGFPTANVVPEAELAPSLGIYAARARVLDGRAAGEVRPAALSVGRNTTFTGPGTAAPVTTEAYLLDFEGDLYDARLRLEVGERLREEIRFDSVAALTAQIARDVDMVRALSS